MILLVSIIDRNPLFIANTYISKQLVGMYIQTCICKKAQFFRRQSVVITRRSIYKENYYLKKRIQ